MTAADRDREAFEAWAKDVMKFTLMERAGGTYMGAASECSWLAWQAALTHARAQAGEPVAWADVLAERQRQVSAEGWTSAHDDEHSDGSLALAAACYAQGDILPSRFAAIGGSVKPGGMAPFLWPKSWHPSWWKPSPDRRRNLVKAAALILAEIERLDRLAKKD